MIRTGNNLMVGPLDKDGLLTTVASPVRPRGPRGHPSQRTSCGTIDCGESMLLYPIDCRLCQPDTSASMFKLMHYRRSGAEELGSVRGKPFLCLPRVPARAKPGK